MNFVVALVILAGFAMAYGEVRNPPVVGGVVPGSAAAAAGLRPGDRITAVAGRSIESFADIGRVVLLRAGEHVELHFERGGAALTADATVASEVERDRFGNEYPIGRLGIMSGAPTLVPVGLIEAPRIAARQIGDIVTLTLETLGRVISGRVSVTQLHGPVGTAKMAGEQLALGWTSFVFLIALVSINLGFINLLPVPMLDGGHLFFYAIEAIRRRPLDTRAQEWAFRAGLAALATLMLVVTFNDLGGFGLWKDLAGLIG